MKFNKVVKAFREYCLLRKKILQEWHKFCNLKEDKPYNTRHKVQIDHCDYEREGCLKAVKIKMTRDKFVWDS